MSPNQQTILVSPCLPRHCTYTDTPQLTVQVDVLHLTVHVDVCYAHWFSHFLHVLFRQKSTVFMGSSKPLKAPPYTIAAMVYCISVNICIMYTCTCSFVDLAAFLWPTETLSELEGVERDKGSLQAMQKGIVLHAQ
jgi:hypothetical protein